MAANAGRHLRRFIDTHEEQTNALGIQLLEYAKTLLKPAANGTQNENVPTGNVNVPTARLDLATQDGYPVMPAVTTKDLKDTLEDLLRRYLAAQYSK
jgi:hypothetical protein